MISLSQALATPANKWDKVFKNGPSQIFGRQPWKNLNWYGLLKQTMSLQNI